VHSCNPNLTIGNALGSGEGEVSMRERKEFLNEDEEQAHKSKAFSFGRSQKSF